MNHATPFGRGETVAIDRWWIARDYKPLASVTRLCLTCLILETKRLDGGDPPLGCVIEIVSFNECAGDVGVVAMPSGLCSSCEDALDTHECDACGGKDPDCEADDHCYIDMPESEVEVD